MNLSRPMPESCLFISRQEDIPEALLEDFVAILRNLCIPFQTEQHGRTVNASLEYFIPTALVVFLAKPFIDGFLKKAGEDAYSAFKHGLAALTSKATSIPLRLVRSSPEKISDLSPYSRVVSVYTHTVSNIRLKFLFPAKTTEAEALIIFDSLLNLLREHHSTPGENALSTIISSSRTHFLKVLYYHADTNTWRLLERLPKQPSEH